RAARLRSISQLHTQLSRSTIGCPPPARLSRRCFRGTMKKLVVCVSLIAASWATGARANGLADVKGFGKARESLTPELIASRTDLLETNLNFYLLRFPDALQAPTRIFEPKLWA